MGSDGGGDGDGQVRRVALDRVLGQFWVAFDEAGVELAATEFRITQNFLVIGRGGAHALHAHVVQRAQATVHCLFPGQRPDDQLQAHRVVIGRNGVAGVDRRVGAHAGAAGRVVTGDLAERGQEVVLRVLGIDAELQGISTVDDVFLLDRQWLAAGDADLLADDIDAGDFLGDGVLHLHPGVHLHEVHLAFGEQELHGAGVLVPNGLRSAHSQVADIGTLLGGKLRAGGDFDELLVTTLDRAIALVQVHGVTEAVGEDLRFDVFGIDDALFQEDFRTAEGLGRLGDDPRVGLLQLLAAVAATNTATATTGGGLEHHRITDALGFTQGFSQVGNVAFSTGCDRYTGLDHAAARFGLVAHAADDFRARPYEFDATLGADLCKFGIFGKKAVTGMQRVATGFHGQIDQLARVQIAGQRIFANAVRLVGTLDVQGMTVRIGVDRYRADAHLGAGPHDADGNLTTVGDQYFSYHDPILSAELQGPLQQLVANVVKPYPAIRINKNE
ncbi:conserved hypothetical protein [Pseudomonas sp. 8O]|nr:conserved hypothetical protein [Pseudomonas sp. 8O]